MTDEEWNKVSRYYYCLHEKGKLVIYAGERRKGFRVFPTGKTFEADQMEEVQEYLDELNGV